MKVRGTIKFTFRQALKVLLCSIFKVEMDIEIEADKIVRAIKHLPTADTTTGEGE